MAIRTYLTSKGSEQKFTGSGAREGHPTILLLTQLSLIAGNDINDPVITERAAAKWKTSIRVEFMARWQQLLQWLSWCLLTAQDGTPQKRQRYSCGTTVETVTKPLALTTERPAVTPIKYPCWNPPYVWSLLHERHKFFIQRLQGQFPTCPYG